MNHRVLRRPQIPPFDPRMKVKSLVAETRQPADGSIWTRERQVFGVRITFGHKTPNKNAARRANLSLKD